MCNETETNVFLIVGIEDNTNNNNFKREHLIIGDANKTNNKQIISNNNIFIKEWAVCHV